MNTDSKNSRKILAVDVGFGGIKYAFLEGNRVRRGKILTSISKLPEGDSLSEGGLEFNGNRYYFGEDSLRLPIEYRVEVSNYEGLREVTPPVLRYLMGALSYDPEIIVLGLSISMIETSADYVNNTAKELNLTSDSIKLIPQGMGCKIALSSLGFNTDKPGGEIPANYVGVDIGFNTLDIFSVIDGMSSGASTVGIPNEGITKLSAMIIGEISKETGMSLKLDDVKSAIEAGYITKRGQNISIKNFVENAAKDYVSQLQELLEEKVSESMDRSECVIFFGGGATVLSSTSVFDDEGFYRIPNSPEYYNVIGFLLSESSK